MSLRSERQGRVGGDPGNECVCSLDVWSYLPNMFKFFVQRLKNPEKDGGGYFELIFAGYVPLAYQNPYPIIV